MKKTDTLRSDIAWSSLDKIVVHGNDLVNDLMGKVNFGDMAFLSVARRLPSPQESAVFNAMLVTLVEHGLVPSTLAARMTHAGAPEAMQASVAAGLLGLGSVFVGSTKNAANMLQQAWRSAPAGASATELAQAIVAEHRVARQIIPGIGHPVHRNGDPRARKLFELAQANGFHGKHVELMVAVADAAHAATGKHLPVNATGAIGALCCEMDLGLDVAGGIGIMARAVGLVGHIMEESHQPMALQIWNRVDEEATEHMKHA
ncbi:MAG TPA: citryl-CoA lyase [Bordetella sp.]|nr:citryl-CoA lyase [Bordetella sp.]